MVAALEVPCGPEQPVAQRSAVCFTDASSGAPGARDYPGGAVCFAGNAAVWAAFRATLRALQPCPA